MRRINKIIAIVMSILCLISTQSVMATADTNSNYQLNIDIFKSLRYLYATQDNSGCWSGNGNNPSAQIANAIELIEKNSADIPSYDVECVNGILNKCIEHYWENYFVNVDMLSNYLLIDELQEDDCVISLLLSQNPDGGFSYQQGLASNPELTAEIADIFGDCIIKDQFEVIKPAILYGTLMKQLLKYRKIL